MGIAVRPPWIVVVSRNRILIPIRRLRTSSRVKTSRSCASGLKQEEKCGVTPPTSEPRNPKKYSSTIGYGALLATMGENGGEGVLDGHGFGKTNYCMLPSGVVMRLPLSIWKPGEGGKKKKKKNLTA
jgi:hypothetical protein